MATYILVNFTSGNFNIDLSSKVFSVIYTIAILQQVVKGANELNAQIMYTLTLHDFISHVEQGLIGEDMFKILSSQNN